MTLPLAVVLQPWSQDDRHILQRTLGDPAMMEHLGGIETPEQIARRHERFLQPLPATEGGMFTISLGPGERVGTIGFWESTWHGERIYETGWMVLPQYGGRGIATRAALAIVERARAQRRHPALHAFPSVKNAASNAVCRKAGFTSAGDCNFEYPKGCLMRCTDWSVKL